MVGRRGFIWRLIHGSTEVKVLLYFFLFTLQIVIYTTIFHYAYPSLEGRSITWPDALYFVMNTITTTGNYVLPPFQNETTILLVILMMLTGVLMIFMVIPLLIGPYISSLLRAAPPRRTPHALMNHAVIVGYDELSRSLIESLMISDLEIIIVESNEEIAREIARKYRKRAFVVWGDYGNAATWVNAWVENAKWIVVNEDERTTAAIILGIREVTQGKIIAIVDKLSFDRYLRYAGAEYVLSPKHVTGRILAHHAVLTSHRVVSAVAGPRRSPFDEPESHEGMLRLIHIPVTPGSRAAGKSLRELALFERYGFDIIFISKNGRFIFHPGADDRIDTSTRIFLLGTADHMIEMVEKEFVSGDDVNALAVIAGYGDVGVAAHREMIAFGIPCTVIDRKAQPVKGVVGNAEDENILRTAKIDDAKFCIVALNDDDLNIFTTLLARDMNPNIRIMARANEPGSVDKLYRAGADYVALLPTIGGQVIGGVVLSDIVKIILDLPDGRKVIRKRIIKHLGHSVSWVEKKSGVRVIGLEGSGRGRVRPAPEEHLVEGDSLIVTGNLDQLKRFIRLI